MCKCSWVRTLLKSWIFVTSPDVVKSYLRPELVSISFKSHITMSKQGANLIEGRIQKVTRAVFFILQRDGQMEQNLLKHCQQVGTKSQLEESPNPLCSQAPLISFEAGSHSSSKESKTSGEILKREVRVVASLLFMRHLITPPLAYQLVKCK